MSIDNSAALNIPVVQRVYDFYKHFHPLVLKFPKTERYSLGQIIQNEALLLLKLSVKAGTASGTTKYEQVRQASVQLDCLKLLVRLAYETKSLSQKDYINLEEQLQEAGKMFGGWTRHLSQQ